MNQMAMSSLLPIPCASFTKSGAIYLSKHYQKCLIFFAWEHDANLDLKVACIHVSKRTQENKKRLHSKILYTHHMKLTEYVLVKTSVLSKLSPGRQAASVLHLAREVHSP